MKAFHNDPAIKAKYQQRLADHRKAERLIQGTGWDSGKGCAVGCTLENYDHTLYPVELGLPEWLARLEGFLFEKLPKGEAEQFAEDFLDAIPVGADVEPVKHRLAIARIDGSLKRLEPNKEAYADECRSALNLVKSWHQSNLDGTATESAWIAAWSAARSAAESAAESAESAESAAESAESAESAAESAAWSASWIAAWSAARSAAESAAESAKSAAESAAESAAWSAAWSAHIRWEADTLLKLLKEAK